MSTEIYVDECCKMLKVNLQPNERRALIEHLNKVMKDLAATKLELPSRSVYNLDKVTIPPEGVKGKTLHDLGGKPPYFAQGNKPNLPSGNDVND